MEPEVVECLERRGGVRGVWRFWGERGECRVREVEPLVEWVVRRVVSFWEEGGREGGWKGKREAWRVPEMEWMVVKVPWRRVLVMEPLIVRRWEL